MSKKKTIDEIFDAYERKLGIFSTCDLGSCQYKVIQDTAELVLDLFDVMGVEKTEAALGIRYSKKIQDIATFENYLTDMADANTWVDFDAAEGLDELTFEELVTRKFPEYLDDYMDRRLSLQAWLRITNDQAWDLWSAIPTVFEDLDFDAFHVPTFGPLFNQLAQADNYRLGIDLAYLLHGLASVGVTMDDFAGFDT
jgi:hypothetical protein